MTAFLYGLVLGAVEGLTEFLPVSSTGHLIIVGDLLDFTGDKAKVFEIVIQFGAILAVVWLYRERFFDLIRSRPGVRFAGMRGLTLLFLTTLPPGLLGLALHDAIKGLFNPASVAVSLAVGGVCMLLVEGRSEPDRVGSLDTLTPGLALAIGCFQCLALWPGFSRSAATIMGGMLLGVRRTVAAEYSFLAAVPLLSAATAYSLLRNRHLLSLEDVPLFAWGGLFSFVFALLAVKGFIGLLGRVTLRPFAWYRLALAPLAYWFLAA
ncbi:MAG: undecaprenyl-diphosphate phosphatase [Deltaproteobacteria bacterium]|jgi:undecaprenyl-diphosphatase|nr:undecaprenyl-diphosphate phosphatase [Deltaproteobacteria bacterium]